MDPGVGSWPPAIAHFHSHNYRPVNWMLGKQSFTLMNSASFLTAIQVLSRMSYHINPWYHLKEKVKTSLEKVFVR